MNEMKEYEIVNSMAMISVANINQFIEAEFITCDDASIQLTNYKKLVKFLSSNKISLDYITSEMLLNTSSKIKYMLDILYDYDKLKTVEMNSNFDSLLLIYSDTYSKVLFSKYNEEQRRRDAKLFNNKEHDIDILGLYLSELPSKVMSCEEEKEMFKRASEGDEKAREYVTIHNLRLVVSFAKYYTKYMEFNDIIQNGNLGLIKAIEKFDYTKGYKFSTYASWWIEQAILRSIADQSRTIRIPVHLHEDIIKVSKAMEKFQKDNGRIPNTIEISKLTGISESRVEKCIKVNIIPVSLSTPVSPDGDGDSELGDFIEDDKYTIEECIEGIDYDNFRQAILNSSLTSKEKAVIVERFGLLDGKKKTLEEVGKKYGVTRERIRQVEAKALRKLGTLSEIRAYASEETLKAYDAKRARAMNYRYYSPNKKIV